MSETTTLYRGTKIVWYVFYFIETLLAFRFVLRLLGANPNAAFSELVYGLSGIFVAPFQFVFGNAAVTAGNIIEWSTLLAMVVYWVLAWAIVKLVLMGRDVNPIEADRALRSQEQV